MSRVSEATNSSTSINKLDYYVDEDAEFTQDDADVATLRRGYDDVASGDLGETRQYYDDVEGEMAGDIELLEMEDEDDVQSVSRYENVADFTTVAPQSGELPAGVYDDVETGTKARQGSYENVPDCCSGPKQTREQDADENDVQSVSRYKNAADCTSGAPQSGELPAGVYDDVETGTKARQGSYENVPDRCSGPKQTREQDADENDVQSVSRYKNAADCTSGAPQSGELPAGVYDDVETGTKARQGSYENVPDRCSGPKQTREQDAGDVGSAAQEAAAAYENMADCTTGLSPSDSRDKALLDSAQASH
ncbi:uncharacterized protein [Heterodontus francisci]|uniref:uncharacterized protein isoform X5 n=1 Tax=Heterodontus francisci TaxID=7792 RepID=UPI00355C9C7E